jgi:hypothetical protein
MALNVGLEASFDNIRPMTGKECGRRQGKLTVRKLMKQMMRHAVEFSTGITRTLLYVCLVCVCVAGTVDTSDRHGCISWLLVCSTQTRCVFN